MRMVDEAAALVAIKHSQCGVYQVFCVNSVFNKMPTCDFAREPNNNKPSQNSATIFTHHTNRNCSTLLTIEYLYPILLSGNTL
jgi:hypothetical protein